MSCSSQLLGPWLCPVLTVNLADCGEFFFFLPMFISFCFSITTASISLTSCVENFLISRFTWHLFKTQIKYSDFFKIQIKYRELIISYRINYLKKSQMYTCTGNVHIKDGGTLKIWSHGACLIMGSLGACLEVSTYTCYWTLAPLLAWWLKINTCGESIVYCF